MFGFSFLLIACTAHNLKYINDTFQLQQPQEDSSHCDHSSPLIGCSLVLDNEHTSERLRGLDEKA